MTETLSLASTLIILSAPSGAGKTSLCQELLRAFAPRLMLSISSTTRMPRGQEQHGKEYFFLSRERFDAAIRRGEFAEWAEVHGNLYGTSRLFLDSALSSGMSVLLDIDVQGARQLRLAYPAKTFSIFVAPPDLDTLEERLRARGTDSPESITRRMNAAREEMRAAPDFDKVIVNDDFPRAAAELRRIVATVMSGTVT